jgi:hypothetical protein
LKELEVHIEVTEHSCINVETSHVSHCRGPIHTDPEVLVAVIQFMEPLFSGFVGSSADSLNVMGSIWESLSVLVNEISLRSDELEEWVLLELG